jgi:hypothetical protein
MNHQLISSRLFDHSIRFGKMLYLAGILSDPENLSDEFSDFLDDISFGDVNPPDGLECLKVEDLDDDTATQLLMENDKFGFLVQAETPVPTYFSDNGFSSSWGYMRTGWFYGEDLKGLVAQAITWHNEIHEKAKAEFRVKQEGQA